VIFLRYLWQALKVAYWAFLNYPRLYRLKQAVEASGDLAHAQAVTKAYLKDLPE
jgi:hypothetical protein